MRYTPKHRAARKPSGLRALGVVAASGVAFAGAGAAAPAASAAPKTDVWDRVAQCESGGDWSISTGNGYHGGLQFSQQSWRAAGGSGSPHGASKAEQKRVAKKLLKMQGPNAWPVCSKKAGLTHANGAAGGNSDTGSVKATSSKSSKKSDSSSRNFSKASVKSERATKSTSSWNNFNSGLSRSETRELQRIVDARVDGVVGPETVRKTERYFGVDRTGKTFFSGSTLKKVNKLV